MAAQNASDEDAVQIDFCTLGMFIIDDIYPPPSSPSPPHLNVIGGAGTFSALGARLLSPAPVLSRTVAAIIDAGTDFPPQLRSLLASWRTSALVRPRADGGPTTRGWNGYGVDEHREFQYLTPKVRLTPADLTPAMARSRSFHLICSAQRCGDMVDAIERLRPAHPPPQHGTGTGTGTGTKTGAGTQTPSSTRPRPLAPIIIWEPVPDLCVSSERQNVFAAQKRVHVISPNHHELGALFDFSHPTTRQGRADDGNDGAGVKESVDRGAVERHANELLARGVGPAGDGAVVVRCGRDGCFVASLDRRKWLPPYYDARRDAADGSKVVDPTGGGNGFLGGFAVGMVRSGGDLVEAARWGSVAASLCIEQVGVPTLTETGAGGEELWNGVSVLQRLEDFRERTS